MSSCWLPTTRPLWVCMANEWDELLKHWGQGLAGIASIATSPVPSLPVPTTKPGSLLLASVEAVSKLGPWLGQELSSSGLGFGIDKPKEARAPRFLPPADTWEDYTGVLIRRRSLFHIPCELRELGLDHMRKELIESASWMASVEKPGLEPKLGKRWVVG